MQFIVIALIALALGFPVVRFVMIPALSPRPELGVTNGQLKRCPNTRNCINSQAASGYSAIAPFSSGDQLPQQAFNRLKAIVSNMDRITIITQTDTYFRAEFRTLVWGFIDDTEFYLDAESGLIHVRSASRLGQDDLGTNRQRLEAIRALFNAGA